MTQNTAIIKNYRDEYQGPAGILLLSSLAKCCLINDGYAGS